VTVPAEQGAWIARNFTSNPGPLIPVAGCGAELGRTIYSAPARPSKGITRLGRAGGGRLESRWEIRENSRYRLDPPKSLPARRRAHGRTAPQPRTRSRSPSPLPAPASRLRGRGPPTGPPAGQQGRPPPPRRHRIRGPRPRPPPRRPRPANRSGRAEKRG